jgi:glyoxylase-like metal-dependent hydrolase (beta-lactamase superfamily II)
MEIVRIVDFGFEVPEGDRMLKVEVCGFGLVANGRRIVIDPWLAFDEKRAEPDGAERWERIAKELAAAGLDPDTVDTVVFTHLDGVGWALGTDGRTPGFPNARHLIAASEVDALHAGHRRGSEGADRLVELGLVEPLEPGTIAPGVEAVVMPGHTAGAIVVHVDGAVFVGHLFLLPAQLHAVERADGEEDPARTIAGRRVVLADARARGVKLYGDLWPEPGWSFAPDPVSQP